MMRNGEKICKDLLRTSLKSTYSAFYVQGEGAE